VEMEVLILTAHGCVRSL